MARSNGETLARDVGKRIHAVVASIAALTALQPDDCVDGCLYIVEDGNQGSGSIWMFNAASTAADTTSQLVVTPTAAPGGVFLRMDKLVDLKMAVGFATADAAVLFTVPTGFKLRIQRAFWEVTTGWTGGSSSSIGMSSSNAAYSTKGDLEGASGGDLAAVLVTSGSPYVGAAGAKTAGAAPVVLVAGDTIKFNQVVSTFTAGAGFAHVLCEMVS